MKKLFLFVIKLYKFLVSPLLVILFGHSCRFIPTCSEYSKDAIQKYGIVKGILLSFKRILRCNPFVAGGYDPLVNTR